MSPPLPCATPARRRQIPLRAPKSRTLCRAPCLGLTIGRLRKGDANTAVSASPGRSQQPITELRQLPSPQWTSCRRRFVPNRSKLIGKRLRLHLESQFLRIAGVSGWPRLFHSMNARGQTELKCEFMSQVVCLWPNNRPQFVQQCYLLVTA